MTANTTLEMVERVATGTAPTRLEVAREAIGLIAEVDRDRLRESVDRVFTPQFRALGPARDLCPRLALSLRPGDFTPFEERSVRIGQMVEQGDRVVAYIEFEGRHGGIFCAEPAGGRLMRADGVVTMRFEAERVAEAWLILRWR